MKCRLLGNLSQVYLVGDLYDNRTSKLFWLIQICLLAQRYQAIVNKLLRSEDTLFCVLKCRQVVLLCILNSRQMFF